MKPHLIFDLDGTLIDSADSILASFALAFEKTATPLHTPLNHGLIGPPLMQTLATLSGSDDPALLHRLAEAFKHEYDQQGFLQTKVYAGINDLLQQCHAVGYACMIATNKRLYPTQQILRLFGWQDLFKAVYALDCVSPPLRNKAAMITHLLQEQQLDAQACLYIGDRVEDGMAADANQMPFTLVTWGYAEALSACQPHWQRCDSVATLQARLLSVDSAITKVSS